VLRIVFHLVAYVVEFNINKALEIITEKILRAISYSYVLIFIINLFCYNLMDILFKILDDFRILIPKH